MPGQQHCLAVRQQTDRHLLLQIRVHDFHLLAFLVGDKQGLAGIIAETHRAAGFMNKVFQLHLAAIDQG